MPQDSTIENYVMRFFNQIMAGLSDTLNFQDRADCVLVKAPPGSGDPNAEAGGLRLPGRYPVTAASSIRPVAAIRLQPYRQHAGLHVTGQNFPLRLDKSITPG